MESTEIGKPKICGVPRQNSRLLLLSAVLLILSGAAMLALRVGFAEKETADRLFPQLAAILFVVTGGLLLFCRRRTELFVPVACVLTAAMCSGNDFAVKFATLAAFAALLLLVSVVGLRVNTRFSALPKWLGLPVFNLASAALSILAALAGAGDTAERYVTRLDIFPGYALVLVLVTRLPLIAVAVLNFSVEPQAVTADDSPRHVTKSAVQPGSLCFQAAAWTLLLCGAGGLLKAAILIPAAGFSFLLQSLLFHLPLVAAAFLLLQNDGREKRFLAAVILLGINVLPGAARSGGFAVWTLLVPVLLMLFSCIGASWNTVPPFARDKFHAPVLNLTAAALLLINTVGTVWRYIPKSPEAPWPAWHSVILTLLLPLALMALNLSLGSCTALRQARRDPDETASRRSFSGLVAWIYGDVGGHLQMLAKIQGIIFLLIALLSLLTAALGGFSFLLGVISGGEMGGGLSMLLVVGGGGFLTSLLLILCTWPLYAFGQITSDVHTLKNSRDATDGAPSQANPDELPEL